MKVTVSVAIMQLEVSATLMPVKISAANMWVATFIEIMQVGVSGGTFCNTNVDGSFFLLL